MKSKKCCYCNKVKPLDQFHVSTQRKDGRTRYCIACGSRSDHGARERRVRLMRRQILDELNRQRR